MGLGRELWLRQDLALWGLVKQEVGGSCRLVRKAWAGLSKVGTQL